MDWIEAMRGWGLVRPEELERIAIVSPHLDDAVLGCGRLLARHPGATVVTVYTGTPPAYPDPPTRWDALARFAPGDDVLAARKREDERALAMLGARPVWLDFVEHQYLERAHWISAKQIVDALEAALRALRPSAVLMPFGLANPDHAETHVAALAVRERLPGPAWFCYEDSGYKHIPGMLAWRVSKLFRSDLWPTPMIVPTVVDHDRKRAAIECYQSQLAPLNRDHALGARIGGSVPEQFWQLAPPPPGWERMREA